jgi:hypothetical protein
MHLDTTLNKKYLDAHTKETTLKERDLLVGE